MNTFLIVGKNPLLDTAARSCSCCAPINNRQTDGRKNERKQARSSRVSERNVCIEQNIHTILPPLFLSPRMLTVTSDALLAWCRFESAAVVVPAADDDEPSPPPSQRCAATRRCMPQDTRSTIDK